MTPDLGAFAPMIQTFFTQTADQVARIAGFVERVSKLTGSLFLQTLVFGFRFDYTLTLRFTQKSTG